MNLDSKVKPDQETNISLILFKCCLNMNQEKTQPIRKKWKELIKIECIFSYSTRDTHTVTDMVITIAPLAILSV